MNSIIVITFFIIVVGIILLNKIDMEKNIDMNYDKQLEKIKYVEEVIPVSEWENNIGVNVDDKVPTKDSAIKISNVVFESLKYPKDKSLYGINQIIYDYEKNIWIICYSYKDLETIGNGYNIAINKTTGKIEKVWADE